jgi:hypothetical protein
VETAACKNINTQHPSTITSAALVFCLLLGVAPSSKAQTPDQVELRGKEFLAHLLTSLNSPDQDPREKERRHRIAALQLGLSAAEVSAFTDESNAVARELDILKANLNHRKSQRLNGTANDERFGQDLRSLIEQRTLIVSSSVLRLWSKLHPNTKSTINSLSLAGDRSRASTLQ